MAQTIKGFKLFQPWATDVVKGKLDLLVRSFPTKNRGKVAVIATPEIDGFWFECAPENVHPSYQLQLDVYSSLLKQMGYEALSLK